MPHLIFLFLIAFLVGADEFLLGPILTPIAADLSVSAESVAYFITAYSLPLALMAPVFGGVSDRFGRLAVLVPSTALFGLASIATSLAATFEAGILTRILTGMASGGMLGIAMAMAGDLGEKAAPRAIAFVTSGLTLGIILSPAIGAFSAAAFSWRLAFAGLGAFAVLVALTGLFLWRGSRERSNQSGAVAKESAGPLFVPGAWASLIAMAAGLGGAVGCFALVGERLRSLYDWDTATVGMIYVGFGVLTALGNLMMPLALVRIPSGRALMRIALVFVLAAIIVTYVFDTVAPALILTALAVWAISGGLGAPGLQTQIAQLSPDRRGTLMALAGSCMNLGVALASGLAARLFSHGPSWVALLGVGLIAIALVALRPVKRGKF